MGKVENLPKKYVPGWVGGLVDGCKKLFLGLLTAIKNASVDTVLIKNLKSNK